MLKQYFKDTSGQFAIMVALCTTALIICIGSAIDFLGVQKQKTDLQDMTDAAVLSAAMLKTDNIGDLKKAVEASFEANNLGGNTVKISVTIVDDSIRVEGASTYDTQLMGVVGMKKLPVAAVSEAPIPKEAPLNIALVLDTTSSMAGPNMDALKSASDKLLDIFADSSPGTIQAGVIPFGEYVNVGLENRARPWMDVPDDYESCYMSKDVISQDCTTASSVGTCYNDMGSYSCENTNTTCTNQVYGPEYEKCSMVVWNGCVGSRDAPDHLDPDYKGSKFPGIMGETCDNEILDLTTNLNDVKSHIDNLTPDDWTYTPAGLAWGWRMLDPDIPYGGLTNSQSDRKKAMILMSDGANSVRLQAPNHYRHYGSTTDAVIQDTNKLTTNLCDGIKAAGIDIYSVAYNLPTADAAAEQVIRDCATNPSYFFSAANQDELDAAFENIAQSLFEVRISK